MWVHLKNMKHIQKFQFVLIGLFVSIFSLQSIAQTPAQHSSTFPVNGTVDKHLVRTVLENTTVHIDHNTVIENGTVVEKSTSTYDPKLWEVFVRSRQGLGHKHVGSLHAVDAEMAIGNARDVYTRRQEGVSIWVVLAENISASSPDDSEALYDPSNDKVYRHPTFYELPDEVNHM